MTGEQMAAVQLTERLPSGPEGDAAIQAAVAAAAGSTGQGAGDIDAAVEPAAGPAEEPRDVRVVQSEATEPIVSSALDAAPAGGLIASANGFDASVDEVIDSVAAIDGAHASGPAADEPAAAATAGASIVI